MLNTYDRLLSYSTFRAYWAREYEQFQNSHEEHELVNTLSAWLKRKDLKELSAQTPFISSFFEKIWGYKGSGQEQNEETSFTSYADFAIEKAGANGNKGSADLALGYFSKSSKSLIPQVLCEFKDIKSALDAPQKRKGNDRSPIKQGLDYLGGARRSVYETDPIKPTWAIITDMNEFRLYWYDRGEKQSIRFIIEQKDLFGISSMLDTRDLEASRFERFLFWKVFHKDTLLSKTGKSILVSLIEAQRYEEKQLENDFYKEYRGFRDYLYEQLLIANPENSPRFPKTKGKLLRLAQKILDRFLFIFYCEDMGGIISFPPNLLRNYIIEKSNASDFDENDQTLWVQMKKLFHSMNVGAIFNAKNINKFNGGLFAQDLALENLIIPNFVFCKKQQGRSDADISAYPKTLLHLCAHYNYASDLGKNEKNSTKTLGLYTLGRIFEQSITELEIKEAEIEGRLSLNKENKRKTDGVYYTPEEVVETIVDQTLLPRLNEIKQECGWLDENPSKEAIEAYIDRLTRFKVLDPACGSGAFLITTLKFLIDHWQTTISYARDKKSKVSLIDKNEIIRTILSQNIYGIDINPASVEISRLALWLHTADGKEPLSSLEKTIVEGNSLVEKNVYNENPIDKKDLVTREEINAFNWKDSFKDVSKQGGFDAIVGNPPYVKLQNFKKVYQHTSDYLLNQNRDLEGTPLYFSTKTGNYDLYLPFIEKGLMMLNQQGRLGYIAPSLWVVNEYGEGLRKEIARHKTLKTWVDYKAFQVFEEATVYTALQFFTKTPNSAINVIDASKGHVKEEAFEKGYQSLSYEAIQYGERWLMVGGAERALIDRLDKQLKKLDDKEITDNIFVGIQTSADSIYHLEKRSKGQYLCFAQDKKSPYLVELEDEIMKPLISGAEAKRYLAPKTNTYLLFPYSTGESPKLFTQTHFQEHYPKAWNYLKSYEKELRRRETNSFNNDDWYKFGRNQNLDKQEIAKLIVAQTVPNMRVCFDEKGGSYLNNVRVNGITVSENIKAWYLLAILNSKVVDFIFKRISRVKDGGFYEANKQFIAPLPIPFISLVDQEPIATLAKTLQNLTTQKQELIERIEKRMGLFVIKTKPLTWLFPSMEKELASHKEQSTALEERYKATLEGLLIGSPTFAPLFIGGELSLDINGFKAIDHIFLKKEEGDFIRAQWQSVLANFKVPETVTPKKSKTGKIEKFPKAKKLIDALTKLAVNDASDKVTQIIELQNELNALSQSIFDKEQELNELIYVLYELDKNEIKLVEKG